MQLLCRLAYLGCFYFPSRSNFLKLINNTVNNINYNHRSFVRSSLNQLIVESDKLDIFYTDPLPRQKWQPVNTLKPYNELKKLIIDIETAGLDSKSNRIGNLLNQLTVRRLLLGQK